MKNVKEMTKDEAYQEMLKGNKVRHEYYSSDEYVFINADGVKCQII